MQARIGNRVERPAELGNEDELGLTDREQRPVEQQTRDNDENRQPQPLPVDLAGGHTIVRMIVSVIMIVRMIVVMMMVVLMMMIVIVTVVGMLVLMHG
jgi:hypothetical protein